MRRRVELKSVGSWVLHSFVSRNNDLDGYWAIGKLYLFAKRLGETSVALDLFKKTLSPDPRRLSGLYKPPNVEILCARYGGMLLRALATRKVPLQWAASATIRVDFDRPDVVPAYVRPGINAKPFGCTLHLVDDLSHEHVLALAGWCWPHDPGIEHRSTRAER
jgi:hypothetical protein